MNTCSCGNIAVTGGTLCARCGALWVLGLESGAGEDEITIVYRMLVKVWHPDRFHNDPKLKAAADDKLKAINSAFSALSSMGFEAPPRQEPRASSTYNDPFRARPKPPPAATPPPAPSPVPAPTPANPVEFRRPRTSRRLHPEMNLLVRALIFLVVLGVCGFFLKMIDSSMSSDPTTGGYYSQYKAQILNQFGDMKRKTFGEVEQKLSDLVSGKKGTNPVAAPLLNGTRTGSAAATNPQQQSRPRRP